MNTEFRVISKGSDTANVWEDTYSNIYSALAYIIHTEPERDGNEIIYIVCDENYCQVMRNYEVKYTRDKREEFVSVVVEIDDYQYAMTATEMRI